MAASQQYSLRWNNYFRHLTYALDNHRNNDDFVDVSLCCDGRKIKAHKVVLSACSGYFKEIFKENPHPHPIIIFKFIKFEDLMSIVEFMYQGEVNVQQEALQSFLQTAELLAVQGLTAEEKEKPKIPSAPLIEEHKLVKTIPSTIRPLNDSMQTGMNATAVSTQTIEIPAAALITQAQIVTQQPQQTQNTAQHHIQIQQTQQHQPATQIQIQQAQQHLSTQHHQHLSANTITISPTTNQLTMQTSAVNTGKKRKNTFSDDDDIYTAESVDYGKDDQGIVKAADMNSFLRGTVKLDIPEYIVSEVDDNALDEASGDHTNEQHTDASGQGVNQFTSEYEILTESEIEEKYHHGNTDSSEITIEMGRLLTQTTGTSTNSQANLDDGIGPGGGMKSDKSNINAAAAIDPPLECKICKRKLQSANALRRHTASRHSDISSKDFECIVCNKTFKTKWSLSTHNSRFHRDLRASKECIKLEFS